MSGDMLMGPARMAGLVKQYKTIKPDMQGARAAAY